MAQVRKEIYICIIVQMILIVTDSSSEILRMFMEWNQVPTSVYLGLLSDTADVQTTDLINGTCFQYSALDFDRCKFYSDCCAMTSSRPLEQLAAGTFSCHGGYYIVDRCPSVTANDELKNLCEHYDKQDTGE